MTTYRGDATPFLPLEKSLDTLRQAASRCAACDLYRVGTQTVFGEGPGEQHGRGHGQSHLNEQRPADVRQDVAPPLPKSLRKELSLFRGVESLLRGPHYRGVEAVRL
jgi:hypothetical protein